MGKGDKKANKKEKGGATVSHMNPFMDDEDDAASVGGGGGGSKKKPGKKGNSKKEQQPASSIVLEEEEGTECSNPALLVDSPRADAGQASSDDEQVAGKEGQTGSEKSSKKGRMRAYLEKKEGVYREQEKAKALENKKQAKVVREKSAKQKTGSEGTRVDNPFGVDDSSDDEGDEGKDADEADGIKDGAGNVSVLNMSRFNPLQLGDREDDDDDERWLEKAMESGSLHMDDAAAAPEADKTFKVKQTAWKGKKVRGHRVKASVSLVVAQMSMRIMDGDVLVCNILYQDVHDWEVRAPKDKGGKPTIDISLIAGSPSFTALGPLVKFASKHAAAIAAQLTYSVSEFREESGTAGYTPGYTPPAGASGGIDDVDSVNSPTTDASNGAEEGVPPEDDVVSHGDDSVPETVESLKSQVDETTQELDGLEDELEKRDDLIEDLRDKLCARDAEVATLQAQVAVLTRENAALKSSLAGSQPDGDAAASGFVAAVSDDEPSVDSIFAAAREADAAKRSAEAVALYTESLKAAFAHLSEHPEVKSEWAAPLKAIANRVKELKQLASQDVDSLMTPRAKLEQVIVSLPEELQTSFADALAAERAGDVAKAAAEYQAGVKLSAGVLKEHPELKAAIAPTLQQIMAHAKQLATQ